jgi:hypothetical protein
MTGTSRRIRRDLSPPGRIGPCGQPAKVKITWPDRPSLIDPGDFADVANTIAALFARAHITLAALRAGGGFN